MTLTQAAQRALNLLTDLEIDTEDEDQAGIIAGVRIDLHEAIISASK